jgi:hypothetical protein
MGLLTAQGHTAPALLALVVANAGVWAQEGPFGMLREQSFPAGKRRAASFAIINGAGNLGDDFMLAGFLTAMRTLAPAATYTCCVPFTLEPLRGRFPAIEWLPYDEATRARCIAGCDVWLGLGGSPFQHAQSRWFVDHLTGEAARCREAGRPMYFMGIGVQSATELNDAAVRAICAQASAVWTRDPASAEFLAALPSPPPSVEAATDLAHVFFREAPLPLAHRGRLTVVANFDYGAWPGQEAFFAAGESTSSPLPVAERHLLGQRSLLVPAPEYALQFSLHHVDFRELLAVQMPFGP